MAENSNKELLQLEATTASTSCLESKLFVCKKDGAFSLPEAPAEKPAMFPVPKSQFLGKVKDFLGVMSESNKKLLHDAKENPNNYDIEVLSGKESEYIELDLMLGVADLRTPEAVAAAESAIAGKQPVINLAESSSESDSDDSSDEDEDDDDDKEEGSHAAIFESKDVERDSSRKVSTKQKPKKRSKIVELP